MLADKSLASAPVTVLGKGRSVIASTIKYDLPRADVEKVLLDGFFPDCPRDAEPARNRAAGLQELGLPYVADAGVTRHLAHFLTRQAEALAGREKPGKKKKDTGLPTAVLFNGGVFKADPMRARFLGVLNQWAKAAKAEATRELSGADLDRSRSSASRPAPAWSRCGTRRRSTSKTAGCSRRWASATSARWTATT